MISEGPPFASSTGFIGFLRMESVRRGVKKWPFDWRANLGEQNASIRHYLGEVTTRYASLVPIRVDLNYEACAFDGTDAKSRMG